MHITSYFLLSATIPNLILAHYTFGRLIFDDHWTKTWEYVREISPEGTSGSLTSLLFPNEDPTSTDIVCGRNATRAWNKPKTAKIRAGAKVGFAPGEPMLPADDYDTPRIYHQGVASAWLSKSTTDDLNDYRGDGDWVKIMSILEPTDQSLDWDLPENKKWYNSLYSQWGTYMLNSLNFTIPPATPPGKYLLRFEHIYPNPGPLGAQFYPNCAHVEITNDDANVGKPSPLVKIPGVYVWGQPDIYIDTYAPDFNFSNSMAPPPVVWRG